MNLTKTSKSLTNGSLLQKADEQIRQTEALRKERSETLDTAIAAFKPVNDRMESNQVEMKELRREVREIVHRQIELVATLELLAETWKSLAHQQREIAGAQQRHFRELERRLQTSHRPQDSGLL